MIRKRTALLAAALSSALIALGVGSTLPAQADTQVNDLGPGLPPAGWLAADWLWEQNFGGSSGGGPQGTVVVDSGFRPYPNGFPLPNWGDDQSFYQSSLVWGTPLRLTAEQVDNGEYPAMRLNSLALRRTFGNGVCRDPKAIDPVSGSCDLVFGAELLAQMIESSAQGGHCFGMAAASAALFNGDIPANQVGASALGINAANPMGNPAQQTITRLFGTQAFSRGIAASFEGQSPTEVVERMKTELTPGRIPWTLGFAGPGGGHEITPYALLDRGNGLYDIAVYDNNFPNKPLAVTVDTVADTFYYTSATDPGSDSYTWSTDDGSILSLDSLDDTLAVQDCPVCRGKDQGTMVAFNAWSAENVAADAIGFGLVDAELDPLSEDLYRVIEVLNPNPQDEDGNFLNKLVSMPVVFVNPGVEFGIRVMTDDLPVKQPLEIWALSNGDSEYLLVDDLASNAETGLFVGKAASVALSDAPMSPRLVSLHDGPRKGFQVNAHPLTLPAGVEASQEWDRKAGRVRLSSSAKKSLNWNVQVLGDDAKAEWNWVAKSVTVPSGAEILVDYSNSSPTAAPQAWLVDKSGARTPISLVKVTDVLLDQDRAELYDLQGPS